jgi:hypothetical protein
MRTFLTLTCCFGLALFAGAAQPQQNNSPPPKKKGGGNAQPQVVTPKTGKVYNAGSGGRPHNFQQPSTVHYKSTGNNTQKWKGPGNVAPASNTKFNKSKTVNKNIAVNKNFQKQHFNLQTNKVVTKYKTVNFNGSYKIAGAQKWGPKYAVFVNYHPVWQSQGWWTSHYNHIVFIYGGWYYWNSNYWYPAWGYAPDSVYYYDGPIYASNPQDDPAQVVANVQSALQQQGYYQGEIDGILGPQTRAALAEYQSAQGIEPTGLVDEPTLETLGMA